MTEPAQDDPQVAADQVVHGLLSCVNDLRKARQDNKTADFILEQETMISLAASGLMVILADIKQANANGRIAAE